MRALQGQGGGRGGASCCWSVRLCWALCSQEGWASKAFREGGKHNTVEKQNTCQPAEGYLGLWQGFPAGILARSPQPPRASWFRIFWQCKPVLGPDPAGSRPFLPDSDFRHYFRFRDWPWNVIFIYFLWLFSKFWWKTSNDLRMHYLIAIRDLKMYRRIMNKLTVTCILLDPDPFQHD